LPGSLAVLPHQPAGGARAPARLVTRVRSPVGRGKGRARASERGDSHAAGRTDRRASRAMAGHAARRCCLGWDFSTQQVPSLGPWPSRGRPRAWASRRRGAPSRCVAAGRELRPGPRPFPERGRPPAGSRGRSGSVPERFTRSPGPRGPSPKTLVAQWSHRLAHTRSGSRPGAGSRLGTAQCTHGLYLPVTALGWHQCAWAADPGLCCLGWG
jgi:hypothetical protein